jgi:hypothetical protein
MVNHKIKILGTTFNLHSTTYKTEQNHNNLLKIRPKLSLHEKNHISCKTWEDNGLEFF